MSKFNFLILRIQLLLLLVFPILVNAEWSDAITIYSGGETADLAIDRNNGSVHIVSYKTGGGLVYTKVDGDGNILEQETVPGTDADGGGYRFSSTIAVDYQGNPHLTYRIHIRNNQYDGYYLYKTGISWSNPIKLFTEIERGNQMRMAIDDNNRVHIVYPKHISDSYAKLNYVQVYNGSIAMQRPEMTGLYEHRVQDHIEIDVSRTGKIYFVAGYPKTGTELQCFSSPDAGTTWQPGFDIRGGSVMSNSTTCGSPDVYVNNENNVVHFCYGSDRDGDIGYGNSIRYGRWVDGTVQRDVAVTAQNELDDWSLSFGIGTVAASDDGKYVVIVYSKKSGGQIRYRFSEDYGATFGYPSELATSSADYDGRDKVKVRAHFKRFYLTYTRGSTVYLRIFSVPGFNPPNAHAGGPYTGQEGSAVTFDASGSSDDKGIASYEWDWNNDGTYDVSITSATTQYTFNDEYSGTISLRVTDVDGMQDVATTTVNISNVNPTPNPGGNVTGNEGSSVNFSVTVTDPGVNDTHTFSWNFGDGTNSTQQNPAHTYADNGNYSVTIIVYDNDGGSGQAQISATINNIAPTASTGGPYSGSIGQPVTLSGSATDPAGANDPLNYAWDTNNDGTYNESGQTVHVTFNSPGVQTIKLRVRDDDGGETVEQTTVNIGKASPVISLIPAQTVNEGTSFPALALDDYVEDLDTPDNQLVWAYSGNDSLSVDLNSSTHEVRVTVPYDEWSGTENITFTVRDPDQNTDQATVAYTVNSVNDPPELNNFSDQYVNEDDTLIVYRTALVALVTDPDNSSNDFVFSIINNSNIHSYYDYNVAGLKIFATANWSGNEQVTLKVEDGAGGSDTKDFQVYVVAQPDAPLPFSLISPLNEVFTAWPASIQFRWNSTTDPDQGDQVTYKWMLSRYENFQTLITQSTDLTANSYTYINSSGKNPGLYYWRVEAIGSDGLKILSTEYGVLNLNSKAPVIGYIANQTIDEGGVFPDLSLNNYVTDGDNSKEELSWRYEGNTGLLVQLSGENVVSVSPPHNKWYGLENITFIVTDPTSLSDSATVIYTVRDVNAKPVLSPIDQISFDEDNVKVLTRSYLEALATDEDNAKSEFSFRLINNYNIKYSIGENGDMTLSTAPNWCGEEIVMLVVDDGAGASDSTSFTTKVKCMPDPPNPFDLTSPTGSILTWFWPLKFSWQEVTDPDPDDTISYLWILSRSETFVDTLDMKWLFNHSTNYYDYMAPYQRKPKGAYYWKMIAFGMDGRFRECNSPASFSLLYEDVEKEPGTDIPAEFALHQNHPNPFNPETHIRYQLPNAGQVKLTVYNSIGRKVRELVNEHQTAGVYTARWDARDEFNNQVSSGIYLCRLIVGEHIFYRKMLFLQ
ncbi:MAG: PKD domain-containing protein [Methanosarcinaceae archaeon]